MDQASKYVAAVDSYAKSAWDYIRQAPLTVQCAMGTVSLYTFYKLVIQKRYKMPPGPWGLPLIGNLAALSSIPMTEKFEEWCKQYGPIFTIRLGGMPVVVINSIDLMFEALVTRGSDISGRPFFYSFDKLAEGSKALSVATYGDTWKYQKKVAVQSLRQYLSGDQFELRVAEVLKLVMNTVDSQTEAFVLRDTLSFAVFNVVHGLCFESLKEFQDPVIFKIYQIIDAFSGDLGNGFLEDILPLIRYWPTKKFTNFMEKTQWFVDYTQQQIELRKTDLHKDSARCLTDTILLTQQELAKEDSSSQAHLTEVHARQLLVDVFGAGLDTSCSTLEWIFLVLVAYPEIQARMQKEIDEVVGERNPGKEHRAKLVYTEAVILETMRLYVVAPIALPHEAICDTTVGGYQIPAKTTVMLHQFYIMRDPKQWEDPLTFKPERFMNEDQTKIAMRNRAFVPFSVGHRSCPGESLAKLEIVYIVVGLLQKLTFSLPPGVKADFTPSDSFLPKAPVYKVVVKHR